MSHAISWFEIPATDYERAVAFYSTVLDCEIGEYESENEAETEGRYGIIQTDDGASGGAIAQLDEYTFEESETTLSYAPSNDSGVLVYLTVSGDIEMALSEVEPAGGEVLVRKAELDDGGHYGIIEDTEGNRIGIMSKD
jgi:predicted enzyme related to lactoylglutathione lyase